MKTTTNAVVALVLAAAKTVSSKMAFSQECDEIRELRMALDLVLATDPSVQEALASLQEEKQPQCDICGSSNVSGHGEICDHCEDAGDISDEERYDAQQEELENLAWLAEQEEAASTEPALDDVQQQRLNNVFLEWEAEQQYYAESLHRLDYLKAHCSDSEFYEEALADLRADMESSLSWFEFYAARVQEIAPGYRK